MYVCELCGPAEAALYWPEDERPQRARRTPGGRPVCHTFPPAGEGGRAERSPIGRQNAGPLADWSEDRQKRGGGGGEKKGIEIAF